MDTYLKSALYRYENRPSAHWARLLKIEIRKGIRKGTFSLDDAYEVMAVASRVDPQERDTYPGIKAEIVRLYPL